MVHIEVNFFLKLLILISDTLEADTLHMNIEEGVNHMWTVSAFSKSSKISMRG
jgi:hypothetical protein